MKTMKFILSLTVAVLLMATPAFAQQTTKELKKELKAKASKDIRKEAKQYEKMVGVRLPEACLSQNN